MVRFLQSQILDKLDSYLGRMETAMDSSDTVEAERLRLELKAETKAVVQHLEQFGDDLSELGLDLARLARAPLTL
jgi:hypothetical protein